VNPQKPPREVGANEARIIMAPLLDDLRFGRPAAITRNGKLAGWLIPITCEHCQAVIRSTSSPTSWWDLENGATCPDGASHEPATTPPIPQPDQEPR
jgi:antitoxin (DNA-binding transcriptional repressor) of toxin-antitoxin stability system